MSDFGVRIGKVLAAFGLCMVLFCVPAGADVKEDLSAIDKAINSIKEQLRPHEEEIHKGIIDYESLSSILFNTHEKLFWIDYNLKYISYSNNDSNIKDIVSKIRLNIIETNNYLNYLRNYLDLALRVNLVRAYFQKNWLPYQVFAIVNNSTFITTGINSKFDTTASDGGGIGIAIWNKRAPLLKAYAEKRGGNWQDLKTQLDFFQQELETIAPKEVARLRNSKTQEEAIKAFDDFMKFYETIK